MGKQNADSRNVKQKTLARFERDSIRSKIIVVREQRVILDHDLADLYGVKTKRLNEQVKRNAERFGGKYVFRLTKSEFDALRSQSATSSGHGGRRYPPHAFTEHGVVMAATVLDSERADKATKLIVDVFVEVARQVRQGEENALAPAPQAITVPATVDRLTTYGEGFSRKLQTMIDKVLNTVIDQQKGSTVRDEAQLVVSEGVKYIKERLKRPGLENEKLAAEVMNVIGQVEQAKAKTARTKAETEHIEFALLIKKLRLLLEAQRAMETDRLDDFLEVLREMDNQPLPEF